MSKLKDEITLDPLAIGYAAMTPAQVIASLKAVTRPAKGGVSSMMQYLVNKNHRTNQGADIVYTPILGRLRAVAASVVGSDPFGRGTGNELLLQNIHASQAFIDLLYSQHLASMDFEDGNLPYGFVQGGGVWGYAHITALKALSQNQQSRAQELGIRLPIQEAHITQARGL